MKPIIIKGGVVRGRGYGSVLGFPTANLERRSYSRLKKKPRLGIYAGLATIGNQTKEYRAAIVIGPLDKKKLPKIEAHLLDFSGTLYDKQLSLTLLSYLRPFQDFSSETSLKNQIQADVERVREIDNKTLPPQRAR